MRFPGVFRNIARRLAGKTILDASTAEELEEALLGADVGFETVEKLLKRLEDSAAHADGVQACLRDSLVELLSSGGSAAVNEGPEKPGVIFVAGVNGVGKTTTIAKLAHFYRKQGREVLLSAADTFRAAAIDQLEIWAGRVGAPIVKHKPGADPAAVVFDSVSAARARGMDLVIVDTAGRLHTRQNLMEELKKITRSVEKANGRPPDETLLVLDATTGQNGVMQAQAFLEHAGVTGLVLTKLDGSAKGGFVLAVQERTGIPVKLLGQGEGIGDLTGFTPHVFAASLVD